MQQYFQSLKVHRGERLGWPPFDDRQTVPAL